MMWSSVSIPGKPRILVVDASHDLGAWEWEFCNRRYASLERRKLRLVGSAPVQVERPEDLTPHLGAGDAGNCTLLFCQGRDQLVPPEASMRSYWAWLNSCGGQVPKLFAAVYLGGLRSRGEPGDTRVRELCAAGAGPTISSYAQGGRPLLHESFHRAGAAL